MQSKHRSGGWVLGDQQLSARRSTPVKSKRASIRCRKGRCIAAVVLFLALGTQLWVRISIVSKSYDLERLRSQALQADSELRELEMVYAVQAQPTAMKVRSKDALGLVPPQPQQVRRISGALS